MRVVPDDEAGVERLAGHDGVGRSDQFGLGVVDAHRLRGGAGGGDQERSRQ